MTDDGLFLVPRYIVGTHPGKEIVGMIVSAHVIKAKLPVFPFAQPTFRRAMGRGRFAARPLTGGTLRPQPPVLVGPHSDTIEQRRVDFHDPSVCAERKLTFKGAWEPLKDRALPY
jgi:hypothetical protein